MVAADDSESLARVPANEDQDYGTARGTATYLPELRGETGVLKSRSARFTFPLPQLPSGALRFQAVRVIVLRL